MTHPLLNTKDRRQRYRGIVKTWSTKRLRAILKTKSLAVDAKNIVYAELRSRQP